MRLPTLTQNYSTRQMTDVFLGYNHNLRISDGEFYDMKNLTSTHYPILAPRQQRGVYIDSNAPKYGLISKDGLGYIENGEFHLNQYSTTDLHLSQEADRRKSSIISMGAYVIIITRDGAGNILDKVWINSTDFEDHGEIDASVEVTETTFTLCDVDGNEYGDVGDTKPDSPTNGTMYIDKSGDKPQLMTYAESSSMWTTVPTTYIKIKSNGIGKPFNQYDGVSISGISVPELADLNNTSIIQAKGDDYIVVIGILSETKDDYSMITVKREMPLMDFVIESGNRLWGCRYGMANNGEIVNEIYASKLGDFKNWNCFMGISTDSYVAGVGTDGQFTGAVTHLGYPIFMKENCMHKVYGNYPANYQVQTTTCRGVQKGCQKSIAIVNETLFYKSRSAVCAYDGSLPVEISAPLGEESYSDAVACSHGNKYYIAMRDANEQYHLFVYDTAKGLWHKEDNTRPVDLCSCSGELYYIDMADEKIKTMFGSGIKDTSPVEWMAETGVIGTDSPDHKYISKLNIRMSLDVGTKVIIYLQYDSNGRWERAATLAGNNLRSFSIPIRPKRCDHLRIKIEGKGDARIYSIAKTIEEGSDA